VYTSLGMSVWAGWSEGLRLARRLHCWMPMKSQQVRQSSVVEADDLRVGAYLAVHSFVGPQRPPREYSEQSGDWEPRACPLELGTPVRVRAVSLPFVVVEVVVPGGVACSPALLDVRRVRLMKVSRAYVSAVQKFPRPEPAFLAFSKPKAVEQVAKGEAE
jgi:hypothetical protein